VYVCVCYSSHAYLLQRPADVELGSDDEDMDDPEDRLPRTYLLSLSLSLRICVSCSDTGVFVVCLAERLTDKRRAHDAEMSDSEDEAGDRRRDVQTTYVPRAYVSVCV